MARCVGVMPVSFSNGMNLRGELRGAWERRSSISLSVNIGIDCGVSCGVSCGVWVDAVDDTVFGSAVFAGAGAFGVRFRIEKILSDFIEFILIRGLGRGLGFPRVVSTHLGPHLGPHL